MNKILKAALFILVSFIVAILFVSKIDVPQRDLVRKALFVVLLIMLVILLDRRSLLTLDSRILQKKDSSCCLAC